MKSCPIEKCGRKFDNDETMLQHVRRRHNDQYEKIKMNLTKSLIENQHIQQQELSKLPKLAKIMSKQKKNFQIHKRSTSKNKKSVGNVSSIIEQSRKIASVNQVLKRPSLPKKVSTQSQDKLPSINSIKGKKLSKIQTKRSSGQKQESNEAEDKFYTTAPNFHSIKNQKTLRSKSKNKKESEKREKTMIQEPVNETLDEKKKQIEGQLKTHYRPLKKHSQKGIQLKKQKPEVEREKQKEKESGKKSSIQDYDFTERTMIIKDWNQKYIACPPFARVQVLYLNNCNLSKIDLNDLESLIELSATHNRLDSMEFLRYPKNNNVRMVHLDYNNIQQIYTPHNIKVLTLSFNKLQTSSIDNACLALRKSPKLEEVDFSFNSFRKAPNYKMKLLMNNEKLKSIDGLKVTKIDKQMMSQYRELYAQERGLIPLGSPYSSKERPSTGVSSVLDEQNMKNAQELIEECDSLEKLIKNTKVQYELIKTENKLIEEEVKSLETEDDDMMNEEVPSLELYEKLKRECECLQLLNFLQYASNEELRVILQKKQ